MIGPTGTICHACKSAADVRPDVARDYLGHIVGTELVHSSFVAETTATIIELKRKLAESERARDADRADAERYRWLRDARSEFSACFSDKPKFDGGAWVRLGSRWVNDALDAAIDAAREVDRG